MESTEEDEDLKLVEASATLLSDLESSLPRLLQHRASAPSVRGRVHSQVRQRDLDYILRLIEPFQGEPQLLDARLKYILPPLVEAHLGYLSTEVRKPQRHVDLQTAICTILYTLCKVRGYKVIVGFLSNEPRYFELILNAAESTIDEDENLQCAWQVPYILLLWLSHLLLTPFDLASISDGAVYNHGLQDMVLPENLPSLAVRTLRVGLLFLPSTTKAQDSAAAMIARLVKRPDMQKMQVADVIVQQSLRVVNAGYSDGSSSIYEPLGFLRLLAAIANTADLGHLFPSIYSICEKLSSDKVDTSLNAVAKKMLVKILRNITIYSVRSTSTGTALLVFLETTSVLENTIDYLLRSLGDRDTPVRYAAAKAISLIILELEPSMGHEIIQAILDTFKEDLPRNSSTRDFRTANPLKWHGLTLALGHALFKRTAAPEQLPDIVTALVLALQFEQRTATSSSLGTNVRDAANFGIWSMSRRYTTNELMAVETSTLDFGLASDAQASVIQFLAVQLILSACLDPAGNIRRGSSAALQELIGRHPNQVFEGIALVQTVEYQAIGLRRRALLDVANRAAALDTMYHTALVAEILQWRGLGSADAPSREASALSIARLHTAGHAGARVPEKVLKAAESLITTEVEAWHGTYLTLAHILDEETKEPHRASHGRVIDVLNWQRLYSLVEGMPGVIATLIPRVLRSEVPVACARLITSVCKAVLQAGEVHLPFPLDSMDSVTERLLARQEDSILEVIPAMVQALLAVKGKEGLPLGCLGETSLRIRIASDSTKSTLTGAGRAIALGASASLYGLGLSGEIAASSIQTLAKLMDAANVDWRIVGLRALQFALQQALKNVPIDPEVMECMGDAVLRGMRDYTIDERGDVGSLVRLQAISCASSMLELRAEATNQASVQLELLRAGVFRLSLEKLDRVRLQASQCLRGPKQRPGDYAAVSRYAYFHKTLQPLQDVTDATLCTALLEGCISCAGVAAESVLQVSRSALIDILSKLENMLLYQHLTSFSNILKDMVLHGANTQPALELLASLLDMQVLQRLIGTDFRWRNLLSTVQKSHHKSNDMPKILAAVHVYSGLADVEVVRGEVLKKLVGMLKTNPYPTVKVNVAETLWMITQDEALLSVDWSQGAEKNRGVLAELQRRYAAN